MVQINFAQKSVTVKIVYYGPGMSGKTTNLEVVHQRAPEGSRGDLTSISTDGDRTLFFDFMPLDLGTVAGMKTQFQIYTVPGQVYYNSTRKLVLQGVDGVIFVADSSSSMMEENLESLRNLEENLAEYGKDIASMPMVVQYNKRDLPDALPVGELERLLNPSGHPSFEAVANTGQGVFPTLKALAAAVLDSIHERAGGDASSAQPSVPPVSSAGSAQVAEAPAAPAPMPEAGAPPTPSMEAPRAVAAQGEPAGSLGMAQPEVPVADAPPAPPAPALDRTVMQQQEPMPMQQQEPMPMQQQQPMPMQGQEPMPMQGQQPMPMQGQQPIASQQPQDLGQAGVHPSMQAGPSVQPAPSQTELGLRISQPVATVEPATTPLAQPQAPSSMMQVPEGATAAPPPATSRSIPAMPSTRIKPRMPAATPVQASARRSAMITAAFMTAALAAGVAIGGLTFGLF